MSLKNVKIEKYMLLTLNFEKKILWNHTSYKFNVISIDSCMTACDYIVILNIDRKIRRA